MMLKFFTAACVTLSLLAATHGQNDELIRMEQDAVRLAASSVSDSVVQIETLGGMEKVGRVLIGTGPTSGLIVSEDGYIVSSAFNFIQQPSSILVTLPNGKRRPATIVARDRSRMLVLLKIDVDAPLSVPVAAPRGELRVGQTVIALGKTFDPGQVNLSVGILSALNRIWSKAVQTDANISPSNYGGPLVDLYGRVVGVLVPLSPQSNAEVAGAEWYDSGIGFAVPLEDVNRQLDRLKSGTDLRPGKLGFAFAGGDQLDPEAKVAVVKLNSPAAEAGLQPGDLVVSINDTPVERHSHVRHLLGPLYAGDAVRLTILRDGETLDMEATLTDVIPPYEHAFLGILPHHRGSNEGVNVRFVYPASPAAEAGLQIGDIVTQLDGEEVENAEQLRTLLVNRQPEQLVRLSWRHGSEAVDGETTLTRLPEDVPAAIPAIEPAPEQTEMPTGKIQIEIPEEPNRCTALVPESINHGPNGGLLVMLVKPGETEVDKIVDRWRAVCDERRLVLLVPEPRDGERWQPRESGYVRKVIDHAIKRFELGDQRVVVLGQEAGGTMAYIVGVRHRDVVRGIAAIDAPPPHRLRQVENEPLERLAILSATASSSTVADRIKAGIKAFRKLKVPVTVLKRDKANAPLSDDERAVIGRWVDNLDRL